MATPRRVTTLAVLTAAVAGLATLPGPPALAHTTDGAVFVNEIHYDNDGTDTGEAIEVAAPSGTDLTGWSLVLYNGSNGAAYDAHSLSGPVAGPEGGFGTAVVTYPANGIQNGSPDGVALVDAAGRVVQLLSYEGTFTAVGGPADGLTSTDIGVAEGSGTPVGHSLQLAGAGDSAADFTWTGPVTGTFGAANAGQRFGTPDGGTDPGTDPGEPADPCSTEPTHEIGDVQGTGATTPLRNQSVTVQGVVVGDFQQGLGGVFLQDADGDGDPATSDGILVYDPDAPELAEGDLVTVTGRAGEYSGQTQISSVSELTGCGAAELPAATALSLPSTTEERERLEGMRVTVAAPVTATDTYQLARYGELRVSSGGRLYNPTNGGTEDDAAEQALNDRRSILLDDGSTEQNPDDVPFTDLDLGDGNPVIRLGDTLTEVTGVLGYGFGEYRIHPTAEPVVERTNPRTEHPDDVGGDLQVASFNVLNYFTTIDRPGAVTDGGHDPRGADSVEELERQQAKIVAAISELDAEVVGLMEIENDADDQAVEHLVAALNAAGDDVYAAVEEPDTGGGVFGTDAIKVAMIYQPDEVVAMGPAVTTTDVAFANARLPLAQRFRPAGGGKPFTVVVNHLKSKSCGQATGANADQGDGQGCWNADRVEQARALLDLVRTLDGEDVLIIGDLNAYGEEDPIDVLEAGGFVDLVDTWLAEQDQYSYVFDGQAGYLDHALASPQGARRVTGVDIWHINADEPLFLDYNTEFNPEGFYQPTAHRSSDHDPVLVGLSRRGNARR